MHISSKCDTWESSSYSRAMRLWSVERIRTNHLSFCTMPLRRPRTFFGSQVFGCHHSQLYRDVVSSHWSFAKLSTRVAQHVQDNFTWLNKLRPGPIGRARMPHCYISILEMSGCRWKLGIVCQSLFCKVLAIPRWYPTRDLFSNHDPSNLHVRRLCPG